MNCLGAVAAVDFGGIVAGAALHEVAVVAGIPDHAVVAGLAEHLVVAVAAGQGVVAVAAEQEVEAALAEQGVVAALAKQHVVAGAAGDRVVAGAAEQIGRGQRADALVERDGVVAALTERPGSALVLATVGGAAFDGDRAAVDQNRSGRVAAEGYGVVEVVAERGENLRSAGYEGRCDGHDRSLLSCAAAGRFGCCLGGFTAGWVAVSVCR